MREKRRRCSGGVWRIDKMVTVEDMLFVSSLPSKGLFHFILLGHIHIKGSLSVGECVGECCVWSERKTKCVAKCLERETTFMI